MSPIPDPPEAKPIRSATWMKIVGAGFAFVLVMAFLGLGAMASMREDVVFNCDTFSFLAPGFAIGAAMSAVFLGGGAAIAGNLGEYFQTRPLAVSLTGGVAVLVIMFGIFFGLQPEDCGTEDVALLQFRSVPDSMNIDPGRGLWTREVREEGRATHEVDVLVTAGVAQEMLDVSQNGTPYCRIMLSFNETFPAQRATHAYEFFEMPTGASFKLDFIPPRQDSDELVVVESCFTHVGRPLVGELHVALNRREVRFARRMPSSEGSVDEFAGGSADVVPQQQDEARLLGGLIAAAHAQALGIDYGELREMLASTNEKLRIEARRLLAADFDTYAPQAVNDLFSPRVQLSPQLTTSLLHGLIGGIETRQPALVPQAGRDLAQTLPYIAGREGDIVELTAHRDSSVRQQARRLMQRFSVDAFEPHVDQVLAEAQSNCPDERMGHKIYATIFYTYNRIIQAGLDGRAPSGPDWDRETDRLQALAGRCITGVEVADAALLDYGRALAYAWAKDEARSRAAVSDFETYLAGRESDYYLQGHLDRMAQLWPN